MTIQQSNKFKRNFYILLGLSFLACLALGWYAYDRTRVIESQEGQILALTDTLVIYRTKDGKNAASKVVFKGSKGEVLAVLKNKNPDLAKVVKETKGIKSVTRLKVETKTDTVVKIDTIYLPTAGKPLFIEKTIEDEWYTANITVKGDSIRLKQKTINEFDFITRDKSNGLFKPKTYVTEVINKNKDTETKGLDSYEITPKTHTGAKVAVGIILGVAAVILLK